MRTSKKFNKIREYLAEINESAYLFNGYENALVGVCERFGTPPVACYDYDKCIDILIRRDKMEFEDAVEFFEFNTIGCGLGENTPVFLKTII